MGARWETQAELVAYMQGLADAGARLVACVANELGPDHPVLDLMAQRLGRLANEAEAD